MERTILTGGFERLDLTYLRRRANETNDERHIFYKAMLKFDSYEEYLEAFGEIKVLAPTFGDGTTPISGRAEILYARRNKRIADRSN